MRAVAASRSAKHLRATPRNSVPYAVGATWRVVRSNRRNPSCVSNSRIRTLRPDGVMNRAPAAREKRSEEHTSELQSRLHLVCRLLLEKKKNHEYIDHNENHIEQNTLEHGLTQFLRRRRGTPTDRHTHQRDDYPKQTLLAERPPRLCTL